MIADQNSMFSGTVGLDGTKTPQAITATTISTNVLDTRNATTPAAADEGIFGCDLWLVVQVPQAFNNLTSLTITLESDSAPGLATAPVVHLSKTILLAALTAGLTAIRVQIPSDDYKRYVGMRYTVNGTAPTTGSVLAWLALDFQSNNLFRSGFGIDL